MRIYLAGPMRGLPNFNFQAFEDATDYLEWLEHDVVSPHEIDMFEGYVHADFQWVDSGVDNRRKRMYVHVALKPSFDLATTLQRDFCEVLKCDAIAFLPGSDESTGARAEAFVAQAIDIQFFEVVPWLHFERGPLSQSMHTRARHQFGVDGWVF